MTKATVKLSYVLYDIEADHYLVTEYDGYDEIMYWRDSLDKSVFKMHEQYLTDPNLYKRFVRNKVINPVEGKIFVQTASGVADFTEPYYMLQDMLRRRLPQWEGE